MVSERTPRDLKLRRAHEFQTDKELDGERAPCRYMAALFQTSLTRVDSRREAILHNLRGRLGESLLPTCWP